MNAAESLLRQAAIAGHTVLPRDVVLRTVSTADVEAALADGSVVDVEWRGAAAWALTDVAESEELLADGLATLADENRLAVVAGPDPAGRRVALARALGAGVPSVVIDDAHRVGLDDVLAAVEDLPEDAVLVLSLDNALPLAAVTGAVALDVAASGICPVLVGDSERDTRALGAARSAVAAGRWTTPSPTADDRSLVLVPVATPDECALRVQQLVAISIPRAFGADEIGVIATDPTGVVGVAALRAALSASAVPDGHADVDAGGAPDAGSARVEVVGAPDASSTRVEVAGVAVGSARVEVVGAPDAVDRVWPAAVLVLPGVVTPALTRAVLYAGLRNGRDHVSIVHGLGSDAAGLAQLVASTTDRPRRTRLAELLRP
jgi:hypothetical protein